MKLTAEILRKRLKYNPETGEFSWIEHFHKSKVGKVAGGNDGEGYIKIRIGGKQYRAHRLAWFYMTGEWPSETIDHRNGIRNDNRWINLRDASGVENSRNRKLQLNSSGVKGVCWHRRDRKWQASIMAGGPRIHLGQFDTKAEAEAAYAKAAAAMHGEFARAA